VNLKRTGCGVWQLECQSSSVTASVQSDHLLRYYLFPVFFDKHFSEFLPARWRQKSTGIDMEQNYVTVTLALRAFAQTYKPDPSSEELAYDLHFWIGANSTQVRTSERAVAFDLHY